jgi:hypothetical protein
MPLYPKFIVLVPFLESTSADGRRSTRTSCSFSSRADVQKIKLASKDRESGQNHGRPVTLQSSHPIRTKH